MSKQIRQFLARGVKLLVEHVTDPLTSAETDLNTVSSLVSSGQRKERFSYVRCHFSVPVLTSRLFGGVVGVFGDIPSELAIPFVLPPLQEFLTETSVGSQISDGLMSELTPSLDLMEVSLGLDQRDEPAVIADADNRDFVGVQATGELDYVNSAYRTSISLMQKDMAAFGATAPWLPDQEVWSGTIDGLNWQRRDVHSNPFVWGKIERSCSPMKAFLLTIAMPDLKQTPILLEVKTYAAVSINVQLVFRHPLVSRDSGGDIQNIPTFHAGEKVARVKQLVGAALPVGAGDLTSDTASPHGVQRMMRVLDSVFLNKLKGGYFPDGARHNLEEHLFDDASYHVEILPFFANFGYERFVRPGTAHELPYVDHPTASTRSPTCHRHVLPISTPMTIHHVFAMVNYGAPLDFGGTHPQTVHFENTIGVLIGTGIRGDDYKYSQVAYRTWAANAKMAVTVDRIKVRSGGLLSADPLEPWDFEIIDVPLVQRAPGAEGIGLLNPQGPPFYVGKTSSQMFSRTSVGGIVPSDNVSEINETFLEVRWEFKNFGGAGGLGGMVATDVLAGYGGHWLILVGKKHLLPRGGVRT